LKLGRRYEQIAVSLVAAIIVGPLAIAGVLKPMERLDVKIDFGCCDTFGKFLAFFLKLEIQLTKEL